MPLIDGYCTPGTERDTVLPIERLLAAMDASHIDMAVIAPQDRELALNNRAGNDRMLKLAENAPGRLVPACCANPWLGAEAVQAMDDAVRGGARMLVLAPSVQGFYLTDELSDPLLRAAGERRVPVYIHTGPHSASTPAHVVMLADQFPKTDFVLGHCGSTDYTHDMPAVLRAALPNLFFELSLVRPWGLPAYAAMVDESKLIFGSSAPRNDLAFELAQFDRHWPIARHPNTYGPNLASLLAQVTP
jgi:predicted TIM-barrel fold metal-dependent hydrolase